jgi:hypothetical protein
MCVPAPHKHTCKEESFTMLQWLIRWASRQSAAPERLAERALHDLRMELYQAEQRVLDAQMQADYYRTRIAFCEEVLKKGIEQVSDDRREQHEVSPHVRPGLKLSAAQLA